MSILKKLLPLLFVLGLSYWAVAPLFIHGFFPIHDDTQVQRVFEMKKALSDGMFPVRWVSDLGYNYGYPIFNFYAPFAYYVGGFLTFAGFDALIATKIMMALGVVLSGVTMYFFARKFWGEIGGMLSAVLYVYAPYHAIQTYVRGDVSEFWAYAFIPLVFLGIYQLFLTFKEDKHYKRPICLWVMIGSLGYAGIILSHNLTAMMVTPFVFIFSILLYFLIFKKIGTVRSLFIFTPIILGILLSTFYWLPTLAEMKYTNVLSIIGGGSDYKDHYVCPMQLWNSPWGFAGSASGCADGMSFKVGKLHISLTVLFILGLLLLRKTKKLDLNAVYFFVVALVLSVFLMFEQSRFIWDTVPKMDFFQFPWRFLIMVSFLTAFLSGGIVILLQKLLNELFVLGIGCSLITLVIFHNAKAFNPQTISNVTVDNYTSPKALTWITSKISDEYMPSKFSKPKNENEVPDRKIIVDNQSATIINLNEKTQLIEAEIDAKQSMTANVKIAYFPAWKFYIDNNPAQYEVLNDGVKVSVPQGRHILKAVYTETPIETYANYLSLTGAFAIILGIITRRKDVSHG